MYDMLPPISQPLGNMTGNVKSKNVILKIFLCIFSNVDAASCVVSINECELMQLHDIQFDHISLLN